MGPAQPLWGLKDDGEPLPGSGPALGVRDETTSRKPPLVSLQPSSERLRVGAEVKCSGILRLSRATAYRVQVAH